MQAQFHVTTHGCVQGERHVIAWEYDENSLKTKPQ